MKNAVYAAAFLLVGTLSAACQGAAPSAVTVGDPHNPTALQSAITDACKAGAKRITLTPGTYLLPRGTDGAGLSFRDLKDVEIDARGVDLSLIATDQDAVDFINCQRVVFRGAAIHFSVPHTGQGKVLAVGEDADGVFYDVQLDAGYPQDAAFKACAMLVGNTHHFRPGTGDFGAKRITPLDAPGKERIHWNGVPKGNTWGAVPGDYVVCRGPGGMMLHAIGCARCTFQDITIYWSGCFAYFDTDGGSANRYLHDTLTYGPAPPGATNRPLLSETADAFHCPGALVGPDIENCTFEGMLDDGIAIHGSYNQVAQANANTLIVGNRWDRNEFAPGDPIRIQNDQSGLLVDAKVTAVAPAQFTPAQPSRYGAFKDALHYFTLTLDRPVNAPFDSLASDPAHSGAGFKIIGCTIRNHRARGMLLKADNGLVKNNTVDGSTIAGIVVSPETYWGEAGYSRNVTIIGNTIRHTNYAMTGPWYPQAGALTIMGEGSMGQRNIQIRGNTFEDINVANIEVRWADGVTIQGNRFLRPHGSASAAGAVGKDHGVDPLAVIWIGDSKNVTLSGNWVRSPGTLAGPLLVVAPTASGIIGQERGIQTAAKTAP